MAEIRNEEWYAGLCVGHTEDEEQRDRYFVETVDGDWIGDVFDTPEAAQEEIERMRKEDGYA